MISRILRIAIRLTFYLTTGVLFLLALGYFGVMANYSLPAKAVFVLAFALGQYHGFLRRRRRNSPASRDAR
jgi:hypothetical protein